MTKSFCLLSVYTMELAAALTTSYCLRVFGLDWNPHSQSMLLITWGKFHLLNLKFIRYLATIIVILAGKATISPGKKRWSWVSTCMSFDVLHFRTFVDYLFQCRCFEISCHFDKFEWGHMSDKSPFHTGLLYRADQSQLIQNLWFIKWHPFFHASWMRLLPLCNIFRAWKCVFTLLKNKLPCFLCLLSLCCIFGNGIS